MSNVHRLKDQDAIEAEAAAWVWRLDDEGASATLRAEYEAWLDADPRHKKAIDDYQEIWDRLDELAVLKRERKIRTVRKGVDEDEFERRWVIPFDAARHAALAATALIAVAAVLLFARGYEAAEVAPDSYATAVGQQRTVTLEDGSVIELNTNSIVKVAYAADSRRIELKKGEAHFSVAKDAGRPFIVRAGETEVRAVGTAFNVHLLPNAPVEVIVTEGIVEVHEGEQALSPPSEEARRGGDARQPEGAGATVRLGEGEALMTAAHDGLAVTAVSPSEIDRTLAWRRGMLVFEGDSLDHVVEELSRYTEARFVILDESIRSRRVGGYFRTGDVESLLSVLEEGLGVTVRRQGDAVILLSDAEQS